MHASRDPAHGRDETTLRRLVARYDRPGPRYTSYPSALEFKDGFGAADYARALGRTAESRGWPLGLYVHVPFCERRCTYCGCHVIPTAKKSVGRDYVDHLLLEAAAVGRTLSGNRPVRVLHLGGGTPTFLSPEEIDRLMRGLRRRLPLEPELEFSVEVDPRVTSVEHLEALRVHGLNRLSLGVQDFDPRVQEAIGRHQSLESTSAVYDAARRLGIESIHFDLVYGLPRQTIDSFARTVETLVAMRPDRIALYAYAHLPDARPHQRAIDAATLPRGYEKLELFLLARDALLGAGYRWIGLDHFARPENELAIAAERRALARNFMGYTPHAGIEIAGLGVSSIGDVGRAYVQNQKRLAPYYRAVHQGGFAVERGLWQSVCDLERRWLIHRLLCRFRIEAEEFQSQFGEALWERYARERGELDAFVEDGLVEFKGDDVEVTPSGRLFARNIAMVFDAYLRRGDAVPSADRFSRTV